MMYLKKIVYTFFLVGVCLCFSSCGTLEKTDFTYENTKTNYGYTALFDPTMSSDLCVVPLDQKDDTDSTMTAESSLIFDTTDQTILYQNNVYEQLYPASITKLMTAYVTFKYANLDDIVTFSYNASHITESGAKLCGFQEGDQVKLSNLLCALLVYSGNDAGVAIAEHVSGSVEAFADLMNKEARTLGATGSHFVNPHGLHDKNHYTTTYDIYLILNELIKNDDFVQMIHSSQVLVPYQDKNGNQFSDTFSTTNQYLLGTTKSPNDVTVIGGKTGTTSKAGSCLAIYSQGENGHFYISIIFKAENKQSLYNQMTQLLHLITKENME
ncbi:MAG: D-alanyl-D-alanine carboxypeptidase family protein [Velocimicrobium sp.]